MAFDDPTNSAKLCGIGLSLPSFSFGFVLPSLPPIPIPALPTPTLVLSCSPSSPINVAGDAKYGGGRTAVRDPDPDTEDA
jgi:hypothetical protein